MREGFRPAFEQVLWRTCFVCGRDGKDALVSQHTMLEGLWVEQVRNLGVGVGEQEVAFAVDERVEVFLHAAGIRTKPRKQRSDPGIDAGHPLRKEGEGERVQRRQRNRSGVGPFL
ncbi:hypothetical protein D9M72_452720 [compost metagenome]